MLSNGNSFGGTPATGPGTAGSAVGDGLDRWPVPAWKLGLRQIHDRGDV